MIEFVRCCDCEKPVRLPETWTGWVRCPHCKSDYPIDKILSDLPPALEAIDPPSFHVTSVDTSTVTDNANAEPLMPKVSVGDRPARTRSKSTTPSGAELIVKSRPHVVVEPDHGRSRVRSPDSLHAERKKAMRRQPSPSAGFLKVALGGIAGLAIGQLILWWLPQPYRTDPLDLAPKLPSPIAFIAPSVLRDAQAERLLPEDSATNGSNAEHSSDHSHGTPVVDDAPLPVEPPKSTRPQEIVLGATEPPIFTLAELRAALESARNADLEFPQNALPDRALATKWYTPLSELAHCMTYADTTEADAAFASDTKAFVSQLAKDTHKRAVMARFAAEELDNGKHERKGVLVPGIVDSITKTEHFYETRLRMSGKQEKSVAVLSRIDPREKPVYQQGSEVLIMGVVVADPSLYLPGYEGKADAIVYGGFPVRLK